MSKTKTHDEQIQLLQRFANDHGIVLQLEGSVGFGRECVGFTHGDNYVAYNPLRYPDFEPVSGFEDDSIGDCAPADAYHKHNCLAVLVHDGDRDNAILQLVQWVEAMNEFGVEVAEYETGATGLQAMMTGVLGRAVRKKA